MEKMDDNEKGTKVVQWPEAVPTHHLSGRRRAAKMAGSLELFYEDGYY
jgi:hypothetical protein